MWQSGTTPRRTFIDREKDNENQLGEFEARKYEDETGRFTSIDEKWEEYRDQTPYNYADTSSDCKNIAKGKNMKVTILEDICIDAGAPMPLVLSTDTALWVLFNSAYDGTDDKDNDSEIIAIMQFRRPLAYKFGMPNDETLSGHPYYKYGISHYTGHYIEGSGWLDELAQINSVHPYHDQEKFKGFSHYILTFHDSTFECVAENYSIEYKRDTFSHALVPILQQVLT